VIYPRRTIGEELMSVASHGCQQCGRKIIPSVSNRCMYCGADLPEEHHLSKEEKNRLLLEKHDRFKQTEENADQIISNMRRDFAIPEKKKPRKTRKQNNEAALAEAISELKSNNNSNSGSKNT
jgi:hypothetical protein